MTRRGARLADLVQVSQEFQDRLALAAEIDQRFTAAERSLRAGEKIQNQSFGFGGVLLAVFLLLGPAGAGDAQKSGVGTDGLLSALRHDDALDVSARRHCDGYVFHRRRTRRAHPRCVATAIEQQEPW